jgi:hypothetical protein
VTKVKLSFINGGIPGLHLVINPQKPLPPEARIHRAFLDHGITLRDKELDAILAGRSESIEAFKKMLETIPGLSPAARLKMATSMADVLLDKSTTGQLSREAPTAVDVLNTKEAVLRAIFNEPTPPGAARGPVFQLLKHPIMPLTLTIHF